MCVVKCNRLFSFFLTYEFGLIVAVTCNNPPFVQNAVTQPSTGPYNCNGAVTYQCNTGYTIQGNSRLTCGNNGQWSGASPTCQQGILFENARN